MWRSIIVAMPLTITEPCAFAQSAPPTFEGDPAVYKVIFENEQFRVIDAIRKAGVHDKAHSHPGPGVVYFVTDCTAKQYGADGKTTERTVKAGTAVEDPIVAPHSAENTGQNDCHQVFERK